MPNKFSSPDDGEFLGWLRDRLVHVYKESPNTDFVLRLEKITDEVKSLESLVPDLQKMLVDIKEITREIKASRG